MGKTAWRKTAWRKTAWTIAAFSVATNMLLLVPPLYMLQLYDRVLSTRSLETLIYISLIALVAMALFAAAEAVRTRLAQAAAARFAADTGERLFASLSKAGRNGGGADPTALMRDFDTVRAFLASRTYLAVFDLPFAPVFLLALALLHPVIGLIALAGCALLALAAWASHRATHAETLKLAQADRTAAQFGQTTLARAGEMRALGLFGSLAQRWSQLTVAAVNGRSDAVATSSVHDGLGKFIRKALQIVIMGSAAWLVVRGHISGGVIFAASMLTARALAPVEALITGFDTIRSARAAHGRITAAAGEEEADDLATLAPAAMAGRLELDRLRLARNGRVLLDGVSLTVEPGRAVCLSGPSGAGKSLVARIAAGSLEPDSGQVLVDSHPRAQWPDARWAACVGTMPQDVLLFPGTLAENVSRFDAALPKGGEASGQLMAAAQVSGAVDVVRSLPQGFATPLGGASRDAVELSAGERALVALARALYCKPRLLILDDPFAHLDADGERRLLATLASARRHGCAILVVSNSARLRRFADEVVEMRAGQIVRPERSRPDAARPRVAAPGLAPSSDELKQGEDA